MGLRPVARTYAAGDTFISTENLMGSGFNDLLLGTNGNNTIWGWNGNDTINGCAGNDTLYGGAGSDIFVCNTALDGATNVESGPPASLARGGFSTAV